VAPNKEVWTFTSREGRVEIEDSVYLASADGARRTVQLVIYGHARHTPSIAWTLQQASPPALVKSAGRGAREEQPKLPL
jgi:uncharacterized heparinase superfamily protein